jgi:D-psicose/D-tagatose/L-ribulose 3-epimerase
MHLSALLTSLPLAFEDAVAEMAKLGFTHVDVVALAERPAPQLEALAKSGLIVSCASIGRDLPAGQTLDAADVASRRAAVETMHRHIADAARLGATHGYVVSGLDSSRDGLFRFGEACTLLADYAQQRQVRLCLEPIPGRALPSAAAMLDFLGGIDHENLALLLDVGHCLISKEEPAEVVRRAGKQLGYVHVDDNNGQGDVHWPLLSGVLREEQLRNCLAALDEAGYQHALSLELNPQNQNPKHGLSEGKALLEKLLLTAT